MTANYSARPSRSGLTKTSERYGGDSASGNPREKGLAENSVATAGSDTESEKILLAATPVQKNDTVRNSNEPFSILSIYLRQAAEVPLLTVAQENELAARINRGDDAAREHMIRANLRLVVKIARDYVHFGVPLLDLISEGNMGLMKAVEKFDPAKGGKLSTYGAWWIKQSIKRAIANQSKTIRLPVHLVDKISRMRRVSFELRELLGREPSEEELAEEMDVSVRKINLWSRASMQTASLDEPTSDDSTRVLADTIPDHSETNPRTELENKGLLKILAEILPTLDKRELSILRERYGLDGNAGRTLDEIGVRFGVTRERIRQLQNSALEKLRQRLEEIEALGHMAV